MPQACRKVLKNDDFFEIDASKLNVLISLVSFSLDCMQRCKSQITVSFDLDLVDAV